MPQRIPSADVLYADLQRRLPSWVFRGLTRHLRRSDAPLLGQGTAGAFVFDEAVVVDEQAPKDPVYGPYCHTFEDYYLWLAALLRQTRILDASGQWLDIHALDRGLYRFPQESDDHLRIRIRRFPELSTERAIHEGVMEAMGPGLPSGYSRCYWGSAFYALTRLAPDLSIDVFTLRYRFLAWTDGVMTNARLRAWGRGARWGRYTFPDKPSLPKRSWFWSIGFWGAGSWTSNGQLRGEREMLNPFAVAVVIVPPQRLYVRTFWRRGWWALSHWGGMSPDLARYRAIRRAVEERRAAGIEVQIWIKGET